MQVTVRSKTAATFIRLARDYILVPQVRQLCQGGGFGVACDTDICLGVVGAERGQARYRGSRKSKEVKFMDLTGKPYADAGTTNPTKL